MLVFIETGEVAHLINRSPARVLQLANAGVLPIAARTTRGLRLFRREDVELYIATIVQERRAAICGARVERKVSMSTG